MPAGSSVPILSTVSRELESPDLITLISRLSSSQHTEILTAAGTPAERWFYMQMSVRERWSIRELWRQIEANLFTRYVSVKSDPGKLLSDDNISAPSKSRLLRLMHRREPTFADALRNSLNCRKMTNEPK